MVGEVLGRPIILSPWWWASSTGIPVAKAGYSQELRKVKQ
jgi:hypothetical protein